ncbi:MAG: hypothetical protein VW709_17585, partial [Rickettsiales bacterium]
MTDFPQKKDLNIHFAHSAYRLAERFEARETGISCFQTWDREETDVRMGEAAVAVMSGFWRNDYL